MRAGGGSRAGSYGFTLLELLVAIIIMAVLAAVVAPSLSGAKSYSLEGQVKSDARTTQIALTNFNNRSVRKEKYPELALTSTGHRYADLFALGGGGGNRVTLLDKAGNQKGTLASKITKTGTNEEVPQRTVIDFAATTDVQDKRGAVQTGRFAPDFLGKVPSSLDLKGSETRGLGTDRNTIEEFLWLLLVNAPSTEQESRTVEVYRLTSAACRNAATPPVGVACADPSAAAVQALTYTQVH